MSKLKINVFIAGRSYPLSVKNTTEEEGLRRAAKSIDNLISNFEQSYAVADKQDVLAMCALQFASKAEITSLKVNEDTTEVLKKINELTKLLDSHLQ